MGHNDSTDALLELLDNMIESLKITEERVGDSFKKVLGAQLSFLSMNCRFCEDRDYCVNLKLIFNEFKHFYEYVTNNNFSKFSKEKKEKLIEDILSIKKLI